MIILEEKCLLHEPVEIPVLTARETVLYEFSPYALLARPNPRLKPGETENMALPSRPALRKLATVAGLIEKTPQAFSMKSEALVEILQGTYPDIASMSDEQVEAAAAELSGGAPAPAPAAARVPVTAPKAAAGPAKSPTKPTAAKPPAAAKKPEPVVEEEELPTEAGEEEPPAEAEAPAAKPAPAAAKPAPAKPSPSKPSAAPAPAVRQPVRSPVAAAPAAAATAPAVDLKPLIDRLDLIGKSGDKNSKAIESILGYLTWQYNGTVAEDQQVKSITEISW